jgi:hypothetical protein
MGSLVVLAPPAAGGGSRGAGGSPRRRRCAFDLVEWCARERYALSTSTPLDGTRLAMAAGGPSAYLRDVVCTARARKPPVSGCLCLVGWCGCDGDDVMVKGCGCDGDDVMM